MEIKVNKVYRLLLGLFVAVILLEGCAAGKALSSVPAVAGDTISVQPSAEPAAPKYTDWYSFEEPAPGYGKRFLRQSIAPLALGLAGGAILAVDSLKYPMQDALNWNKEDRVNLLDDQLRHAPYLIAATLPLFGMCPKHKPLHYLSLISCSYLLADMIVHQTKGLTQIERPNGDAYNSFPSQHASMSFVAATILHLEFGQYSPWISVGGYALASWVAYSRVARNKHWVPDVLVGAAIGTLSTNLVYFCYDAMSDWLAPEKISITPYMLNGGGGVSISCVF